MPKRTLKIFFSFYITIILLLLIYLFIPVAKNILYEKVGFSYKIYDRNGQLLRRGLSTKGFYFSYVKLDEIPHELLNAFLVSEDKNYFKHFGIDLLSMTRAIFQTLLSKNKVYGGSTITMQVARNIHNLDRNIFSKIFEMYMALKLEISFTKKQIFELYCNTIPFGNKIIGIKMAARYYFNKRVNDLSTAECAFLAACIKYPNYINNEKIKRVIKRQKYILYKLKKLKLISMKIHKRAYTEKIKILKMKKFILAPHFTDFIINKIKKDYPESYKIISEIHTTLDLSIQKKVFNKSAGVLNRLLHKQITNASVIVLDNDKKELLAMLGSLNYFSNKTSGQVNGSIALRSPGSTLKPFTYATAFENRTITPATVIPDIKTFIQSYHGDYTPSNDDRRYHGPLTVRKALACSYNIPAARIIRKAGVDKVLVKMKQCGFTSLTKPAEHYGASLVLGGADISLYELTRAYMTFANNGVYHDVKIIKKVVNIYGKNITKKNPKIITKVYSKETAFLIKSILSDNKAREDNFTLFSALNLPFFCASKTGTSKGFRNNWTIGFSRNYTVGVWVGNFNNRPMQGVSGITGAGSIYRNIMLNIERDYDYKIKSTENIVQVKICPYSGLLAKSYCQGKVIEYFIKGTEPKRFCDAHYKIPFYKNTKKIAFNIKYNSRNRHKNIVWKTFLILPDIYNEWLTQKGYKSPSPHVLKYINGKPQNVENINMKVKIIFPDNNDVFAIDPIVSRKHQKLTFRASVPIITEKIIWQINNKKMICKQNPYTLNWKIKRGTFKLIASAYLKNGTILKSEPVRFTVQ